MTWNDDRNEQDWTEADRRFAQVARQRLRASESTIDAATAARLAAMRARAVALAGAAPAHRWREQRYWLLPASLAAALVLALMLTPSHHASTPAPALAASAETLDLLGDETDPRFYRDLDFYRWLAAQNGHA